VSRYLNGIVRAVVAAVAHTHRGHLRAIEIGGGTGGTTSAVLPALPAARTDYVFTDVSELFLSHAELKFAGYPFVRYGILDFERDPQEQGYERHSFDVVVAANVLHATSDLRLTLDRALALLAPGGVLVLSETTSHPHHFDITTGLIEGWQVFADDLRRDNPLIGARRWVELLEERGFVESAAFPEQGEPAEVLGNHVIIASAPDDGVSRPAAAQPARPAAAAKAEGARTPAETETPAGALLAELRQALPAERQRLLAEFVRDRVMAILRLDAQHALSLTGRLMDLGLDSLMAVHLRNEVAAGLVLARPLSATLVFDHPTCEAIAAYLDREYFESGGETPRASAAPKPVSAPPAADAVRTREIEHMTDAETEALLVRRLESIRERTP